MTCKNCGAEIPENETRCPKCGASAEAAPAAQTAEAAETPRGFSNKRNILIIAIALVVLIIGGAVTAVAVTRGGAQNAESIMTLAERYLKEENYEQAVIEFQRVIELDPMNMDAYLNLAEAYLGLGDKEKALEVLREGLEKTGDSRLQEKIDELTKPEESSSAAQSSSVPESKPVSTIPVSDINNDKECLEIEDMIKRFLRGEGEVDVSCLENVKGLTIYGTELVGIEMEGRRYGTRLNGWSSSGVNENGSTNLSSGEKVEFAYGNIDSLNEDIPFVFQMPKLEKLKICFNPITNLSEAAKIGTLRDLSVEITPQIDISAISEMKLLDNLSIWGDDISGLSALRSNSTIRNLYLSGRMDDISSVSFMKALEHLSLHVPGGDGFVDASMLSGLTSLKNLYIFDSAVKNASAIGNLTNLETLRCQDWNISDYSFVANLSKLDYFVLHNYHNDNEPIDLSFLASLSSLRTIDLRSPGITDISPLMGLKKVQRLYLSNSENIPEEQISQFKESHPDCTVTAN